MKVNRCSCGVQPYYTGMHTNGMRYHEVVCLNCGRKTGKNVSKDSAAEEWNVKPIIHNEGDYNMIKNKCPFCDNTKEFEIQDLDSECFYVHCCQCGADGSYFNTSFGMTAEECRAKAIERWNNATKGV